MRRFLFRLALSLGKTVAELERDLGPREFAEWIAYAQIEPFGPDRQDYAVAIVAHTVAQTMGGKSARSLTPRDFLPFPQGVAAQRAEMSPDLIAARMQQFAGEVRKMRERRAMRKG